ncbi:MAG: dynamin family protein, partial [Rhodobacteraceae bacterium]|nr:dynamin family protein [Paracoccaceae bacterium]
MSYDGTQPRRVSMPKYNRLKAWAERRPIVALMGEFSAGKSTLMNFLIEEDLLPTRATATELPPVWLSHGERSAHWVDADGGAHPLDLAEIRKVPIDARFIRIHATAEILEHCDIIDTPGISDPNLAVESWRYVAGQSNMVLWCSSATQAWRETERSAWLSLPERLRRNSLLVVTRADKLLTETDRQKVSRRLARETGDLFARHVFVATHDAVQAKAELAQGIESRLWAESGAEALLDALAERFEAIYEQRLALLRRYEVEGQNQDQGRGVVQARRATDIRAEQSERMAQQAQRSPYVLEPGQRTDDFAAGPVPVRPVRPASGTPRPARLDASARAEIVEKLRAGLGGEALDLPGFARDAGDAGREAASDTGAPAAARDGAAVVHVDFGRGEDASGRQAGMAADEDAAVAWPAEARAPAGTAWDFGREMPPEAADAAPTPAFGAEGPAAPAFAEGFEDEPAELDPLTAEGPAPGSGLAAEVPTAAASAFAEGFEDEPAELGPLTAEGPAPGSGLAAGAPTAAAPAFAETFEDEPAELGPLTAEGLAPGSGLAAEAPTAAAPAFAGLAEMPFETAGDEGPADAAPHEPFAETEAFGAFGAGHGPAEPEAPQDPAPAA